MTNRLKRPKWNMYPVAVESPEGKLCSISTCIRDVKWKILDSFYCQDHITHPKQEKFTFIGGPGNGEANQVERQGKEVAGSVSGAGRGSDDRRPGESVLRERGSGEQQTWQQLGPQLASEAGSTQAGDPDGAGRLLPGEALEGDFIEAPQAHGETEEFGAEEDDRNALD